MDKQAREQTKSLERDRRTENQGNPNRHVDRGVLTRGENTGHWSERKKIDKEIGEMAFTASKPHDDVEQRLRHDADDRHEEQTAGGGL